MLLHMSRKLSLHVFMMKITSFICMCKLSFDKFSEPLMEAAVKQPGPLNAN